MVLVVWRPLARALVLLLLLSAGAYAGARDVPGTGADGPQLAVAGACADVLLLGVDGAGEVPAADQPLGPTLTTFTDAYRLAAARSDRGIEVRRVETAFAPTLQLLRSPDATGSAREAVTSGRTRAWHSGVSSAVPALTSAVQTAAVDCPEQVMVLAGYSQGASVVHRALAPLTEAGLASRVAGLALVGDPDRAADTRAPHLLGAPAAPLSAVGVRTELLRAAPDVPPPGVDIDVWQICSRGDLVCDFGRFPVRRALAKHAGYTTDDAAAQLGAAAAGLWARTRVWPVPKPRDASITLRRGDEVSKQLRVDVDPAARDGVRWGDVTGTPPGVVLDELGRLSGTPTEAGTWEVGFTTRNLAPATSATAGSLTVTVVGSSTGTDATAGVSAGGQNSCEVRADGTAWCWGANQFGQLGTGNRAGHTLPVRVGVDKDWASISASGSTACGIRTDTTLWCWGMNHRGQLGIGGAGPAVLSPRKVAGTGWSQVSTGWLHTCGVKVDGSAWCWGLNDYGQLGLGDAGVRAEPRRVGSASTWTQVTVGGWHTCGVREDASAWCWGQDKLGQVGNGAPAGSRSPVEVGTAQRWAQVDASWGHTCGVTRDRKLLCWGVNDDGQLGDGTRQSRSTPQPVDSGQSWRSVAAGDAHTCAINEEHSVFCWGSNRYGQYGDIAEPSRKTPELVDRSADWETLDSGWFHTCAGTLAGTHRCWGGNEAGQLGTGTRDATSPVTPPAVNRAAGTPDEFVLTTFNILGSQHSVPGGASSNFAPGRIRTEWASELITRYGSSIIGFQEIQRDQLAAIQRIHSDYAAYPGTAEGPRGVWTTMMWDTSVWKAESKEIFMIPFRGNERPNPVVVLRNKQTGRQVAVMNVHNSAQLMPVRERERDRATAIEISRIKALRAQNIPVLFIGDMNEHAEVFCKVTGQTDLKAAQGGSNTGGCRPPRPMRVDWIFGSPQLSNFRLDNGARVTRATDHSVLTTTVSLPASG